MADGYADLALAYLANGFYPIPVQSKHPVPSGATGHSGTVTEEKVQQWLSDEAWRDQNLALRAHGFIGIDVDHYGEKTGANQLAELEFQLGELPVTISSTARGEDSASRTYYYAVPEGLNFATKVSPDIDLIQRSHRYSLVYPSWHPILGTQYEWYDESGELMDDIPSINDFENLPEKWIEYLKVDPITSHDGFQGGIEEWLETLSEGEPSYRVRKWLEQVPVDGFNHDDVIRLTYSLVRLGAEGDAGVRQAFTHLYNLWVKPPYDTPHYTRELTEAINGAIRKAGAKEEYDLPPYSEIIHKIPEETLSKLIGPPLEKGQVRILKEIVSLGLPREEILSVGMSAATLRGAWSFERLNQLVDQTIQENSVKKGEFIDPPQTTPADQSELVRISLLTESERKRVKKAKNFITRYDEIATRKLPARNYPYHLANALTCLSVMFADSGLIPHKQGKRGTNLYIMISGLAGSLKSENVAIAKRILNEFWADDPDYDLGGNFSESALAKALIGRDKKVSSIWRDDVHGWFKQVMKVDWQTGVIDSLCTLFDGNVPKMLRSGDKDVSNKTSAVDLVMHLDGTPEELHRTLTREFLTNGFISRLLIFQGDNIEPTPESLAEIDAEYDEDGNFIHDEIHQWVGELRGNRDKVRQRYGKSPIGLTQEARDRLSQGKVDMYNILPRGHIDYNVLKPSRLRAGMMARKIAALLAMSRGERVSSLDDVLYALWIMEQSLTNLLDFSRHLSASEYERDTNAIYNFIASKKGGKARRSEVAGAFVMKPGDFMGMISSLISRGLIKEETTGNVEWLIAKGLE